MLVFPLISCGGKTPEVNTPMPAPPDANQTQEHTPTPEQILSDSESPWFFIDYEAVTQEGIHLKLNSTTNSQMLVGYPIAQIIRSYEEIPYRGSAAYKPYDRAFFENNNLLVIMQQIDGSGQATASATCAYKQSFDGKDKFMFDLTYSEPQNDGLMRSAYTVMIAMDKSYNIQDDNIVLRFLEPVVTITYRDAEMVPVINITDWVFCIVSHEDQTV